MAGMLLCMPAAWARQSAQISGAYLREICKSHSDGSEVIAGGHTACQAYIAGVLDYHGILKALGTAPSLSICFPETPVTISTMQKIVSKYLENNPPTDAFSAAPAVIMALAKAYPCKKR